MASERVFRARDVEDVVDRLGQEELAAIVKSVVWDAFGDVDDGGQAIELVRPERDPDEVDTESIVTTLRQRLWPEFYPDGDATATPVTIDVRVLYRTLRTQDAVLDPRDAAALAHDILDAAVPTTSAETTFRARKFLDERSHVRVVVKTVKGRKRITCVDCNAQWFKGDAVAKCGAEIDYD